MESQTDDENTQQSTLISNEEIDSRSLMEFMIANPCFIYGDDPGVLKCTIDGTIIKWKVKKGIEPLNKHLRTQRHIVALDLKEKKKQELILNEQRAVDFVLWMTTYNIPFSKIDEGFTNYLQNISGHIYYSRTHYIEEFLPSIYKKHLDNIRAYFDKNPYYIMLDESPDIKKRKILNILIGELSFESNAKPFLLNTVELENTTAAHIYDVILRELSLIHSEFKNRTNFKLLISDKAAYCLALGKRLKESIKGIKHITCLCHALHNLCETIKESKKTYWKS